MYYLVDFARKKGSKDKQKRKRGYRPLDFVGGALSGAVLGANLGTGFRYLPSEQLQKKLKLTDNQFKTYLAKNKVTEKAINTKAALKGAGIGTASMLGLMGGMSLYKHLKNKKK